MNRHRKHSVNDHALFVNHGRLVFENLYAALEHPAVGGASGGFRQRLVVILAGKNEFHIDLSLHSFHQQIDLIVGQQCNKRS